MRISIDIFRSYNYFEIKFLQKSNGPIITINISTHTGNIRYIHILGVKEMPIINRLSISGYRNITKIKRVQREYQETINKLIKKAKDET